MSAHVEQRQNLNLPSILTHQGWTIRYGLHNSSNTQGASSDESETVIFVHGTPWSSDVFQPIAKALLARKACQVLLYDLPGYGQSQELDTVDPKTTHDGRFAGDTSVKAQASALAALIEHLELKKPAVIAHDIAGTIALRTHLIHGCNFLSLLLLDTNCVLPWGDGFYKLVRSEPDIFLKLPTAFFEAIARTTPRTACYNPKVLGSGWEDTLVEPWITADGSGQRSFVRQIAQANDADIAEMLDQDMYSKVRCDVKILWGEQDKWIPREKMDQLATMLGHRLREFVVIPEAGHLLMLDQPERVAVEVFDWLAQH